MKTKFFSLAVIVIISFASCSKKPMACCDVPTTGTSGQSISFSSSCSMDAEQYEWDFGDGSTVSKEANPAHVFVLAGTYTVSLMVMDKKGKNMDETSKSIVIN